MEKFEQTSMQENINNSSLKNAEIAISQENPDLPMKLKFEVSPKETLDKLLAVNSWRFYCFSKR